MSRELADIFETSAQNYVVVRKAKIEDVMRTVEETLSVDEGMLSSIRAVLDHLTGQTLRELFGGPGGSGHGFIDPSDWLNPGTPSFIDPSELFDTAALDHMGLLGLLAALMGCQGSIGDQIITEIVVAADESDRKRGMGRYAPQPNPNASYNQKGCESGGVTYVETGGEHGGGGKKRWHRVAKSYDDRDAGPADEETEAYCNGETDEDPNAIDDVDSDFFPPDLPRGGTGYILYIEHRLYAQVIVQVQQMIALAMRREIEYR